MTLSMAAPPLGPAKAHSTATHTPQPVSAPRRRVLIVSPNFPPSSSPDMQRVRMSLPHFREFGWEPTVLAVAPDPQAANDPLLSLTIPSDIAVERVAAAPLALTRWFGIGNIALRALPFLNRTGLRLLRTQQYDLVYFSTTMFFAMPLGRWWRMRTNVPFVLDIQDPWLTDYYETHPEATPPKKHGVARRAHAFLERWTMSATSGLIAVSEPYIRTLRRRYPWLSSAPALTLPFAASQADFELLDRHPQPNPYFSADDGLVHGVYTGRAGDDMRSAVRILVGALTTGRTRFPAEFNRVRLHFVGTNYSTGADARQTVAPVARELGGGELVVESTSRAPYFTALQLLKDAAFLVLIGSDDPDYTASKVYPYLLAGKPIVAVVHERSGLVPVLNAAPQAVLVTFGDDDEAAAIELLVSAWRDLLQRTGTVPSDEAAVRSYGAREMTRQQCALFDAVLANQAAPSSLHVDGQAGRR